MISSGSSVGRSCSAQESSRNVGIVWLTISWWKLVEIPAVVGVEEQGVLVALLVAPVGAADVPAVSGASADDTSRGEVAGMEIGAMPSAALRQAREWLAERHEVGTATCEGSRRDAGLGLWFFLLSLALGGFFPFLAAAITVRLFVFACFFLSVAFC